MSSSISNAAAREKVRPPIITRRCSIVSITCLHNSDQSRRSGLSLQKSAFTVRRRSRSGFDSRNRFGRSIASTHQFRYSASPKHRRDLFIAFPANLNRIAHIDQGEEFLDIPAYPCEYILSTPLYRSNVADLFRECRSLSRSTPSIACRQGCPCQLRRHGLCGSTLVADACHDFEFADRTRCGTLAYRDAINANDFSVREQCHLAVGDADENRSNAALESSGISRLGAAATDVCSAALCGGHCYYCR